MTETIYDYPTWPSLGKKPVTTTWEDVEGDVDSSNYGGTSKIANGSYTDSDTFYDLDEMFGKGGNDTLVGGHDDDTLDGGDGNDKLYGGSASNPNGGDGSYSRILMFSTKKRDAGDDWLRGNAGDDTIYGAQGNDTLIGDRIAFYDADDGGGENILHGGTGNDLIYGDGGNDVLNGGGGSDTLMAGYGDDLIITGEIGTGDVDVVTGGGGSDIFYLGGEGSTDYKNSSLLGAASFSSTLLAYGSPLVGMDSPLFRTFGLTSGALKIATGIVGLIEGATENSAKVNTFADDFVKVNDFNPLEDIVILPIDGDASFTVEYDEVTADDFTEGNTGLTGIKLHAGNGKTIANLYGAEFDEYSNLWEQVVDNRITIQVGDDGEKTITSAANGESISNTQLIEYLGDDDAASVFDNLNNGDSVVILGAYGPQNLIGDTNSTALNDNLVGTFYNDFLTGGEGSDTLIGGEGSDTAVYTDAESAITVNLSTSSVQNDGFGSSDTLDSIENIAGSTYDDTVSYSGADSDVNVKVYSSFETYESLDSSISNLVDVENIIGSANNDTADFSDFDSSLTFTVDSTGTVTVEDPSTSEYYTLTNFEQFVGSSNHTAYLELGVDASNYTFEGFGSVGGNESLEGTASNDSLVSGAGNDTIQGNAGNDTIDAGAGNDTIQGNAGNDTIDAGAGNDTIQGNAGNDTIDAGSGNDTLEGGSGNDTLEGGSGNDYINGGDDDDTVIGGQGADTMYGGAGYDILDFADGDQGIRFHMKTFYGYAYDAWGNEDDFNEYDHGFELIKGTSDDDFMMVHNSDAKTYNYDVDLMGEAGNDFLGGSGTDQSLDGGTGADTLRSGSGDDTLTGGTGADVFMYDGKYGDIDPLQRVNHVGIRANLVRVDVPVTREHLSFRT